MSTIISKGFVALLFSSSAFCGSAILVFCYSSVLRLSYSSWCSGYYTCSAVLLLICPFFAVLLFCCSAVILFLPNILLYCCTAVLLFCSSSRWVLPMGFGRFLLFAASIGICHESVIHSLVPETKNRRVDSVRIESQLGKTYRAHRSPPNSWCRLIFECGTHLIECRRLLRYGGFSSPLQYSIVYV